MREPFLRRMIVLFCSLAYGSLHQVVVGSQYPHTKSTLEGLSRQALINIILGTTEEPPSAEQPLPHTALENSTSPSTTSYSEDKFYLYPLDKKYWWRWPDHNSSCVAHNQVGHQHAMNSGQCCYW